MWHDIFWLYSVPQTSQKLLCKFGSHCSSQNSEEDMLELTLLSNWNQNLMSTILYLLYSILHVILTSSADSGNFEQEIDNVNSNKISKKLSVV